MTQSGVDLIQPVTRSAPVPMYEQVKQELREHIRRGGVGVGGQLPPMRELCRLFDVSRQTITKALDEIEAEGVIYRIQGKGTFVRSEPRIEAQFSELRGFTDTLARMGLQTHSDLVKAQNVPATAAVDAFFHLPPNPERSYVEITRLRYAGDQPVVLNTSIVSSDLGKWMLAHSLETASYYEMFREHSGLPVTREDHIISVCDVDSETAVALHTPLGSTHFLVDSEVFVGDGIPIERSRSIFHRDHFRFHVRSVSFVPGETVK